MELNWKCLFCLPDLIVPEGAAHTAGAKTQWSHLTEAMLATILTHQTRDAYWCNSGIALLGLTNQFVIALEACCIRGNIHLVPQTRSKPMAEKILGPSRD